MPQDKKVEKSIDLGQNATDRGTALAKALAGAVPVAGSFIAELLEQVIPNQRQDRFASYVGLLETRLADLEHSLNADELSPSQTALFEDGAHAAVRAITSERLRHIARIVAEGIAGDTLMAEDQRRFLVMLNSLFDEDIVALCSHTRIKAARSRTKSMTGGEIKQATDKELLRYKERSAIEAQQDHRLISLGLLHQESSVHLETRSYRQPKPHIVPHKPRITGQGLVLLSKLGLVQLARISEFTVDWVLAP
ncbi:MAG: hypothetical protein ABMA14_18590, partial [Hyphomonadaceae bacterium]